MMQGAIAETARAPGAGGGFPPAAAAWLMLSMALCMAAGLAPPDADDAEEETEMDPENEEMLRTLGYLN